MEAAGLYGVAAEYGASALVICTVSAHMIRENEVISDEDKHIFNNMIEIALESILISDLKK